MTRVTPHVFAAATKLAAKHPEDEMHLLFQRTRAAESSPSGYSRFGLKGIKFVSMERTVAKIHSVVFVDFGGPPRTLLTTCSGGEPSATDAFTKISGPKIILSDIIRLSAEQNSVKSFMASFANTVFQSYYRIYAYNY